MHYIVDYSQIVLVIKAREVSEEDWLHSPYRFEGTRHCF